jgi:uncharacterized RDD family membrane protein YckC
VLGRRALARLLDAGLPLLVVVAGSGLLSRAGMDRDRAVVASGLVAVWAYWLYETVLTARSGQTLGKRLVSIRVAALGTETAKPGLRRSATRALPILLLAVPYLWVVVPLFFVWAAFRSDQRGLHDLAAGTQVIAGRWLTGAPPDQ